MISSKVLGASLDQNGNIKVQAEYTLTDGSKVIGHTRYNFLTFSKANILKDIKDHCETLMSKVYSLKVHQDLIKTNISDVKYQCTSAVIEIKPPEFDDQGNITTPAQTLTIDDK